MFHVKSCQEKVHQDQGLSGPIMLYISAQSLCMSSTERAAVLESLGQINMLPGLAAWGTSTCWKNVLELSW